MSAQTTGLTSTNAGPSATRWYRLKRSFSLAAVLGVGLGVLTAAAPSNSAGPRAEPVQSQQPAAIEREAPVRIVPASAEVPIETLRLRALQVAEAALARLRADPKLNRPADLQKAAEEVVSRLRTPAVDTPSSQPPLVRFDPAAPGLDFEVNPVTGTLQINLVRLKAKMNVRGWSEGAMARALMNLVRFHHGAGKRDQDASDLLHALAKAHQASPDGPLPDREVIRRNISLMANVELDLVRTTLHYRRHIAAGNGQTLEQHFAEIFEVPSAEKLQPPQQELLLLNRDPSLDNEDLRVMHYRRLIPKEVKTLVEAVAARSDGARTPEEVERWLRDAFAVYAPPPLAPEF